MRPNLREVNEIIIFLLGRGRVYLAFERFASQAEVKAWNEEAKEALLDLVSKIIFLTITENKKMRRSDFKIRVRKKIVHSCKLSAVHTLKACTKLETTCDEKSDYTIYPTSSSMREPHHPKKTRSSTSH